MVENRIINNLLANMIKHSHANKLVVQIIEEISEVQIVIIDNGVGIEEKDLPFIFERLYKCDTSRTENSNGLGLAIAKALYFKHETLEDYFTLLTGGAKFE